MSFSAPELAAIDRLLNYYNSNASDATTNPGGLANDGHQVNFPAALQDLSIAATAIGREAGNAESAAAATAADVLLTAADVIATAADRVATGNDVTSTNADALATAADVLATAADLVATNADAAATAADKLATNADAAATAADRIATGNDASSTAADLLATNADALATAADAIATAADVVTATAQAGIATTKAGEADASAFAAATSEANAAATLANAAKKDQNLADLTDKTAAFNEIKQAATETQTGVVERATQAEVDAGTDTGRVLTPATHAAHAGHYTPNLLINGDFQVWQRGTSFVSAGNVYAADRWKSFNCSSVLRVEDSPNDRSQYCIEFGNSISTLPFLDYYIEARDAVKLVGDTLSLQLFIKNIAGTTTAVAYFATADAVDNFAAATSFSTIDLGAPSASWEQKKVTSSVVPAAGANGIMVRIYRNADISTQRLAQVKLEAGDVHTEFAPRPYSEEMALCQRYFLSIKAGQRWMAAAALEIAETGVNFPVIMRAAPAIAITAGIRSNVGSTPTTFNADPSGCRFYAQSAAAGDAYALNETITADAEL